jgi:hypothetical protein
MANSRGPESLKDLVPGELKWLGADMGQHNDEIYCGRLGMSAEEIERLKRDGII